MLIIFIIETIIRTIIQPIIIIIQKILLFHQDMIGEKITPIHIRVFSSDYTHHPGEKNNSWKRVLKLSLSDFTNDVVVKLFKRWSMDS